MQQLDRYLHHTSIGLWSLLWSHQRDRHASGNEGM